MDEQEFKGVDKLRRSVEMGIAEASMALRFGGQGLNPRIEVDLTPQSPVQIAEAIAGLLKANANLNVRTDDGWNLPTFAAHFGTARAVTALLKAGVDLHADTEDHWTLLAFCGGWHSYEWQSRDGSVGSGRISGSREPKRT